MSSLEDYLGSAQAREDVQVLLTRQPWSLEGDKSYTTDDGACWADDSTEAWRCVCLCFADLDTISVYYRPDGERFSVSDLGEGVRALRLRTGTRRAELTPDIERMLAGQQTERVQIRLCLGDELMYTDFRSDAVFSSAADDLPDALCRTLLASHRVANLGAERSGDGE